MRTSRRQKYNAKPTMVDGLRFASTAEARRWSELRFCEMARTISKLQRQVPFVLYTRTGAPLHKIVVDFVYVENDKTIAEDVKGVITDLARAKLNHLAADYDVEVRIYRRGRAVETIEPKRSAA